MSSVDEKFRNPGIDSAPGQEVRRSDGGGLSALARGDKPAGGLVDFSQNHQGAVDAARRIVEMANRYSE